MPLTSALNLHLLDTHKTGLTCPENASAELSAFCSSLGEYRRDVDYIIYAYAIAVVFKTKCGMYETVIDSPRRNTVRHLAKRLQENEEVVRHIYELRDKDDYLTIFEFLKKL